MKLSWQPDAVAGEFEGDTADEAVRLARLALGDDAPVRCWRTRRGGVAGFFARETFVAATAPPAGAVKRVKTPRPTSSPRTPEQAETNAAPKERLAPAPQEDESAVSPNASELVEWPQDDVVLGSDPAAEDAFLSVLAEAEAAVHAAPLLTCTEPESAAPLRTAAPDSPERIEDLRDRLRALGVPRQFLPDEQNSTFDGLAGALAKLPKADSLPRTGGSVIVVIGPRRQVQTAARAVLSSLELEPSDLVVADPNDVSRQRVARRRSANKVTVVSVEASLRSRTLPLVADWVERVQPDHVLGAVPVVAKRADVLEWQERVGRIDALALAGLAETATPGELMGELPIAYLEGREASVLRWELLLLSAMTEHTR